MTRSRPNPAIILGSALGLVVLFVFGPSIPPAAEPPAEAQDKPDHTVLLTAIEFRPNRLVVAAGDKIKFINQDKFDHDIYYGGQ